MREAPRRLIRWIFRRPTASEIDDVRVVTQLRAAYGQAFDSHVVEQYRLFVETEEKLVGRRQEENRFFLTVNSVLLAVISLLLRQNVSDWEAGLGILILGLSGTVLCYAWWAIIDSYKRLNTAKFKVIDQFEAQLPARMFGAEWDIAQAGGYEPFTVIESRVPIVFGLLTTSAAVIGALAVAGVISSS